MKKLLTLAIILLTQFSFSQNSVKPQIKRLRNDTIVWKADSLLKKEDFKARGKGQSIAGYTASGLFIYPNESNGVLVFNVEAVFVKSKSFIVKYSDYMLKHEQLHFDICELYARKLRQKLTETDFKKVRNIQQVITNAYNKINGDYTKEQEKYDKETEHSMNAAKQQVWADDIARRITELDAFAGTEINTVK